MSVIYPSKNRILNHPKLALRIPTTTDILRSLKLHGKSHWRLLQVGTVILALMVVSLTWIFTFQRMNVEASQAVASATTAQQNLAAVMAENLSQVLERAKLMARSSRFSVDADSVASARRLGDISASDPLFLGYALYGIQGQRLHSAPTFQESADLVQSVQELLASSSSEVQQALLPPISTQDERAWKLPLLTTLHGSSGHPNGVMVVLLDLGYWAAAGSVDTHLSF